MRKSSREAAAGKDLMPAGDAPANAGDGKRYTREQILDAERYRERRDLLRALLEEGKRYSLEEVDGLTEAYMKGKVN